MTGRARHVLVTLFQGGALVVLIAVAGVSVANQQIMAEFGRPWRLSDGTTPESFDVAIVPGCRVYGQRPVPLLEARLTAALNLYRSGKVHRIFVTGNGTAGEPTAMKHWLVVRGVPEGDILVDNEGTRTLESMRHASELGFRSAVVCTQSLHLARSLFLAREAGLEAVGEEAALDQSRWMRSQVVEALKRTLAFAEVRGLGRLQKPAPTLASR